MLLPWLEQIVCCWLQMHKQSRWSRAADKDCLLWMVLLGVGKREQKEEGLGQKRAASHVGFEGTRQTILS